MIRVTSTLIVHRPERRLYYLPELTQEVKQCMQKGECPVALEAYRDVFGAYDEAGIFYLTQDLQEQTGMSWVVGIEFREGDDSIAAPTEFPSLVLPACHVIIQDIAYQHELDESLLDEIINYARDTENVRSPLYQYVNGGIVCAFPMGEKLRIMYEIQLVEEPERFSYHVGDGVIEKELYDKAYREPITGYYSWPWMWESLSTYYKEGIKDYTFVHFDIKDFKMVNELYNHQIANDVLKRIADNIEANSDWIYYGARCHNDNFAFMMKAMPEEETKKQLFQFFEEVSRIPEDPTYKIFYRCGVVEMRTAMNTGDTVADCAKLAQSMGKAINETEIHFYTKEMHDDVLWGKQLKAYLDTALQEDEFLVYLQPKMDIHTETVCGAEALIRWNYKHKGLMSPFRFVPYFETDDSIVKVDEFVLRSVCAKLKEWNEKGYPLYPISVNLSRRHMEQVNLATHLEEIVDAYGVDHALIEFELTETVEYDNQTYMISIMQELKDKGFLISMDDFGTGYSSFSLLKEMPLDTLKIDKSFVDLLIKDEDVDKIQIILRHILLMAKELGIHSIAEGAEEREQIVALRELGCEKIQGYYYSKPIPVEDFEMQYLQSCNE